VIEICAFTFSLYELEEILSNKNIDFGERVNQIINNLPSSSRNGVLGLREFRKFLKKKSIVNSLEKLEGMLAQYDKI
jgi:hypothetical protein